MEVYFFHCIKLDDFYYYLNNKNAELQGISSEFLKNNIIDIIIEINHPIQKIND